MDIRLLPSLCPQMRFRIRQSTSPFGALDVLYSRLQYFVTVFRAWTNSGLGRENNSRGLLKP